MLWTDANPHTEFKHPPTSYNILGIMGQTGTATNYLVPGSTIHSSHQVEGQRQY